MTQAVILWMALLVGPQSTDSGHRAPLRADPLQAGHDASAFKPIDAAIIDSGGYLAAHPDQRFRLLGAKARREGRPREAREHFRKAARYADKLSQGVLAEMYWNGEGGERNRVLGYIWMDLAAERGAPLLIAHRERYWSQMTHRERVEAKRVGQAIYAEYGDEAAKPRLARKLVTASRRVTGSRLGWVGNLTICMEPSAGRCGTLVTGEQYYADRYWNPAKYWEWQDRILLTPTNSGEVEVGPVETVRPQDGGEEK